MPLQIRRGNTAERLSIVPLQGEPILDTDLDTIFIGNGTTAGGVALTGITSEEVMDIIGQMFLNGQHQGISFSYGSTQDAANRIDASVDISDYLSDYLSNYDGEVVASAFRGSLYANDSTLLVNAETGEINASAISGTFTGNVIGDLYGSVFGESSTTLVDATNSSINLDGTVKGNIIPIESEVFDIGSDSNRFRHLYLSGSSLFLGAANITAAGTAINLPEGSTVNGIPIGTGSGDGIIDGSNYNINIIGDDSSVIVNSATKAIIASSITGNLNGDAAGNHTGTFTGNIFTTLIDSEDSSTISFTPSVVFNSDLTVQNELTVTNSVTAEDVNTNNLTVQNELTVTNSVTAEDVNANNLYVTTADINYAQINTSAVIQERLAIRGDNVLAGLVLNRNASNNTSNNITFAKSRNTYDNPTAVIFGDEFGRLSFQGYDGSNYLETGAIASSVTLGSVSPGQIPSILSFSTMSQTGTNTRPNMILRYGFTDESSVLGLVRMEGSLASPSAVLNGSVIGDYSFLASDGVAFRQSGFIRGTVDGTVGVNQVPTRISMHHTDTAGTLRNPLTINSDSSIQINRYNYVSNILSFDQIHSNAGSSNFNFQRSRGTSGSKTTVQSSDEIIKMNFIGFNGSSDFTSSSISSEVVSIDGSNNVLSNFTVQMHDGSSLSTKFILENTGTIDHKQTALTAGVGSGQVDTSSVVSYMRVKLNGTEYALPLYAINP